MDWFQQTKQTLRKPSYINWFMKLYPIPVGIVTSKLIASVVEEALAGDIERVLLLCGIILGILVFIKILDIILERKFEELTSKAKQRCKMELYKQFLENPLHILYASEQGDSIEKLTDDFNMVTRNSIQTYPSLWSAVFTALAYLIVIAAQNVWIALLLMVFSILQIIPPIVIKKYLQINYDNCRDMEGQLTDYILEGFYGFVTIKLYNLKSWWLERLKGLHQKYLVIGKRVDMAGAAEDTMVYFVDNILKYGTYALIGLFILLQYATLNEGVQAIALSSGFFGAVKMCFSSIESFAVEKTARKRLQSWFLADGKGKTSLDGGGIRCSDVSFSYGEKKILSHCSFLIEGNRLSVIKGENGIGKSTLFQLMTGMLTDFEGELSVGGKNPASFSGNAFPEGLFYLPQQDMEFDFSAYELFQMAMPKEMNKVMRLAEEFRLNGELMKAKKIKELSGGERKKVFLSLAFAVNPILLLLDEPTNSLDLEGEKILKRLLEGRERSTIVITHNNGFEDIADHVFVMAHGGVSNEKAE